jgi:sugar lactone lactonase YvrE
MQRSIRPCNTTSIRGRMRRALAVATFVALASQSFVASAALGDTFPDAIIGQPDSTSRTPNATGVNANGLNYPNASALDAAGNLYVADVENNRVLIYRSPLKTDRTADIVLGQPDFNSKAGNNGGPPSASTLWQPVDVTVDRFGNVWVADSANNRVLEYDNPLVTDVVADRVIGQPDFTSNTPNNGGIGASTLYSPTSVVVDGAGNLWVGDNGNLRVLEYDTPLASGDRIADLVVCQPDFQSDRPGVSATKVQTITGIAIDGKNNLWVCDPLNSRVLEFDDPKHTDTTADRVLGQPSFTNDNANYTGRVDGLGLYNAYDVAVDANGNVYVADIGNNRVLFYRAPIALSDRLADHVFGQPDLNSDKVNNGGVSATSLFNPSGVASGPTGDIVIADQANHRVIVLQTPVPIIKAISLKVSKTCKGHLVISGYGMVAGSATVAVDGAPLAVVKYKLLTSDGTAGVIKATDPNFDAIVWPGRTVDVTVATPGSPLQSAPIPVTRH